jgi:hypothetical protein
MTEKRQRQYATSSQFATVLLRWMPQWASSTPEGKLIASVFAQAWEDGVHWFFKEDCKQLLFYCGRVQLNPKAVAEAYRRGNHRYAKFIGSEA